MSKSASSSQAGSGSQSISSSDDQNLNEHDPDGDDGAHRDPERLERAYEKYGTIDKTAAYFDVSTTTIRKYLIKNELYVPESQAEDSDHPVRARELKEMGPEDVGLTPIGER